MTKQIRKLIINNALKLGFLTISPLTYNIKTAYSTFITISKNTLNINLTFILNSPTQSIHKPSVLALEVVS